MALLHLVAEEPIAEDAVDGYFEVLYRIVCVGEKPAGARPESAVVRSTYIVDWEQLVHLLEEYAGFGEDIVEVTALPASEARVLRGFLTANGSVARA